MKRGSHSSEVGSFDKRKVEERRRLDDADTRGSSERPGTNGSDALRIVLCPVNTAGVPWTIAESLRARGHDARLVVFERYGLHPEADVSLDRSGGFARRQLTQWQAFARLVPHTDIFHFIFGLTLIPQSFQYPLLKLLGKKSVMHYLGSDIRGKTPEQLKAGDRKSTRLNSSHLRLSRMPSSA